jgi:hypothetical protein
MKRNSVDVFYELAKKSFNPEEMRRMVIPVSLEDEVAFHKINERLLERVKGANYRRMQEAYPFVKLNGKWHFSVVNFWVWVDAAKEAMIMTKDKRMIAVFNAYASQKKYVAECQELFNRISPTNQGSWESYQRQMGVLYENAMMEQMEIFAA